MANLIRLDRGAEKAIAVMCHSTAARSPNPHALSRRRRNFVTFRAKLD